MVAGIGFVNRPTPPAPKQNRILLLSSPWPNKRTDLAVDYLERWRRQSRYPGTIEVVGSTPADLVKPESTAWRWHSRLPSSEYERLAAEARVLVFFSEYEGFGMPPVEAVLKGTCPVFSDIPATREVMSGAGFSFSNPSFESFVHAMNSSLQVTPCCLEEWKQQLLYRHNWDRVVSRVLSGLGSSR